MGLTGRYNFRRSWRSRLTFIVEEEYQSLWGGEKRRWRSATLADLAEPEMRQLLNFRFERQFRRGGSGLVKAAAQPSLLHNDSLRSRPDQQPPQ